jgi:hypothetical protein
MIAKEDVFGTTTEQCAKLPSLVQQISQKDLLSSVFLDVDEEGNFQNFFWSFVYARHFSSLQQKLFLVDGAVMKSLPNLTKNVECEKEWTVFLKRCNNHIDHFNYSDCAIISDRDKGT